MIQALCLLAGFTIFMLFGAYTAFGPRQDHRG